MSSTAPEDIRLHALKRLNILDTPREQAYDEIIQLVQNILQVPIALVSLVDRNRQWFKACIGLPISETSREVSFCSVAIARPDLSEPYIIPDATLDPRFCNNPLVLGPPHIRLYVGMALVTAEGYALGSLCAIDDKPRVPTESQLAALKTLARSVRNLITLRQTADDLRESEERNRLIVSTARDAVITVKADGSIASWNAGAETVFGSAAADVMGKPLAATLFDPSHPYAQGLGLVTKLQMGGCGGYIGSETVAVRRADGREIRAEMSTACLQTRDGNVFSIFLRDLTDFEQKQAFERDAAMRDVTIFAMAKLAESRDPETGAHIERVQHYCKALAEQLAHSGPYVEQIDEEFVRLMYSTSPLHDIGKVGIPDSVLLKPGRLSDSEFAMMKAHTQIGADTLAAAMERFPNTPFLQVACSIAASHHERFDGTGYPNGISGTDIPLCGRILAVADVYDALSSRRVYKAAFSHDVARSIIVKDSGTHFDPAIVEAFLAVEGAFQSISQRTAEMALSEAA